MYVLKEIECVHFKERKCTNSDKYSHLLKKSSMEERYALVRVARNRKAYMQQ
jgi:hypothetical protein